MAAVQVHAADFGLSLALPRGPSAVRRRSQITRADIFHYCVLIVRRKKASCPRRELSAEKPRRAPSKKNITPFHYGQFDDSLLKGLARGMPANGGACVQRNGRLASPCPCRVFSQNAIDHHA
jgi:hypothetical protein